MQIFRIIEYTFQMISYLPEVDAYSQRLRRDLSASPHRDAAAGFCCNINDSHCLGDQTQEWETHAYAGAAI